MIPPLVLKFIPDIIVSSIITYITKRYSSKILDKTVGRALNKTEKIVEKVVINKNKEENNKPLKETIETLKKIKNIPPNETAHLKYCVLLSYAYGKYDDEKLLELLKEKGCLDEEDIKYLKEEFTE